MWVSQQGLVVSLIASAAELPMRLAHRFMHNASKNSLLCLYHQHCLCLRLMSYRASGFAWLRRRHRARVARR